MQGRGSRSSAQGSSQLGRRELLVLLRLRSAASRGDAVPRASRGPRRRRARARIVEGGRRLLRCEPAQARARVEGGRRLLRREPAQQRRRRGRAAGEGRPEGGGGGGGRAPRARALGGGSGGRGGAPGSALDLVLEAEEIPAAAAPEAEEERGGEERDGGEEGVAPAAGHLAGGGGGGGLREKPRLLIPFRRE